MLLPEGKREGLWALLAGCTLIAAALGTSAAAPENVPAAYAELYAELERRLDANLTQLKSAPASTPAAKPIYCVDLLAANSNRGPALLLPVTLATVRLSLDRFQSMGVQCVKFALQYPLLREDFPHAAAYLDFYREVVQEAHRRNIKVMPHVTVLFADTPFSPFQNTYAGLDWARFKKEYRDMVQLIARALQPDYLSLITEPDTQARLTGLRELNQPETVAEVVQFALQGIDRSKTRFGAGSGSWSPPTFAAALAKLPEVDFIAIHIYPINGPMLFNARTMARLAHEHRKQAFIDEAWLYKVMRPGGGDNVAAAAGIFRRDCYAFWQPLDIKFMQLVLGLAAKERIELVSFFWSSFLFSYLEYTPELDRLSYAELRRRHNQLVYQNMREGKLSAVGTFLRKTISGNRPKE